MKKIEITLVILAIAALVLRVSSVAGAEWLTLITFLMLGLFYLLGAIPYFNGISFRHIFQKAGYEHLNGFQKFWAGAAGIVFFVALTGILFVLNYWKGASFFWCLGMFFTVPVAALSLGKHLLQTTPFCKAIAIRAGILLLAGIALVAAQM